MKFCKIHKVFKEKRIGTALLLLFLWMSKVVFVKNKSLT